MVGALAKTSLVRLVPGGAGLPPDVVRRRVLAGVLVVLLTSLLQTLPVVQRGGTAVQAAIRFGVSSIEMLAVVLAASVVYSACLAKRRTTAVTMIATLAVGVCTAMVLLVPFRWAVGHVSWLRSSHDSGFSFARTVLFSVFAGVLHCGVWALAFVFPYFAEHTRMRALEADKLRAEAEQLRSAAELARLRSQLEPHFLLNTLNAIAGLVTEDPREARRLIACLGDLLRDSLKDGDELQPLEEEIAWLRRYAEILQSRHAGSLAFEWAIDENASHALVPRLLLQPLVENAVKHGALLRRSGGRVTVRAHLAESEGEKRVVCSVEDNGPGLKSRAPRPGGGFGLHSVRRRLEIRYPDAKLKIESTQAGTRSIVEMPCGDAP